MLSKKDLILISAEKIIAQKGFDGLSMQQVAKEARVSVGTIYLYFTCKDDLIASVKKMVISSISKAVLHGITPSNSSWGNYRIVWFNILTYAKERNEHKLSLEQYFKIPDISDDSSQNEDIALFQPLYELYQGAIINGEIIDIGINYLIALSLESAVALARDLKRGRIEYNAILLNDICKISWDAICKK